MSGNRSITPLKIIASGVALPENKIYSSMLDEKLNKPKGFVEKHSGIEYRFHASHTDSQAVLASWRFKMHCMRTISYQAVLIC